MKINGDFCESVYKNSVGKPKKARGVDMKWDKWLENWDMTALKIKAPFLEMEWCPAEPDKNAAWELYIELLTRITTQDLVARDGDERTALESVYSLFPTSREIIKSLRCFSDLTLRRRQIVHR